MEQINKLWRIVIAVTVIFITSCSSIPTMPVKFSVAADSAINPDKYSTSLPLRLKIYQLTEPQLFKEATFRQLWKSEKAFLGDTLLAKKEITIIPDQKMVFKINRVKEAKYVAVLALFRKPERSKWRVIKQLPGQVGSVVKTIHLDINGNTMEVR